MSNLIDDTFELEREIYINYQAKQRRLIDETFEKEHALYIKKSLENSQQKCGFSENQTSDVWDISLTKKLQEILGLFPDGIISCQPKENKKFLPNISKGTIQFRGGTGSLLIHTLQAKLSHRLTRGILIDGYIGKDTVRALQAFLNDNCDAPTRLTGVVDSSTVISLKESIEDGSFKREINDYVAPLRFITVEGATYEQELYKTKDGYYIRRRRIP